MTAKPVSWKLPVILAVFALIAFVFFGLLGPHQTASFGISTGSDFFQLPALEIPRLRRRHRPRPCCCWPWPPTPSTSRPRDRTVPGWLTVAFIVLFVAAFLIWVVGGARTPASPWPASIAGSVTLAVPLVFGSLSGVLCERVGVVNIAIEGQLLGGAFTAAIVATMTQQPLHRPASPRPSPAPLVSMVLALFSIKYVVNQIIVGVVLNVLVSGVTGFLFSTVDAGGQGRSSTRRPRLDIIRSRSCPTSRIIGPILFQQSLVGYLMYVAVIVVWVGLFKTRWGLRVRAVGEHPQAADTLGINVNATRFWNVTLGGAVAGIGGSFFTLVAIDSFTKEISGGRGFIALAALIFGRWNPIGAFFAALLFGFADNLQSIVTIIGTPVPSQFMAMLPVPGDRPRRRRPGGKSRPPAASGIPYVKG